MPISLRYSCSLTLALDGDALLEQALGIRNNRTPMLAWNGLTTDNDTSEHRGVALMMAGTFSYFGTFPLTCPRSVFEL